MVHDDALLLLHFVVLKLVSHLLQNLLFLLNGLIEKWVIDNESLCLIFRHAVLFAALFQRFQFRGNCCQFVRVIADKGVNQPLALRFCLYLVLLANCGLKGRHPFAGTGFFPFFQKALSLLFDYVREFGGNDFRGYILRIFRVIVELC